MAVASFARRQNRLPTLWSPHHSVSISSTEKYIPRNAASLLRWNFWAFKWTWTDVLLLTSSLLPYAANRSHRILIASGTASNLIGALSTYSALSCPRRLPSL